MLFYLKDELQTRLLIAKNGRSLRGFAKDIGISHTYLSQILNQHKLPSAVIAFKISKGLKKDIQEIFLIKMVDKTTGIVSDLERSRENYGTIPNSNRVKS